MEAYRQLTGIRLTEKEVMTQLPRHLDRKSLTHAYRSSTESRTIEAFAAEVARDGEPR